MTRIAILMSACLLASCAPAEDTGMGARGSAKQPCLEKPPDSSTRSWEATAKCGSTGGGGGGPACSPEPEIMGDGMDQDCDGFDACYQDLDGDGYGTATVINDETYQGCNVPGRSVYAGDCQDDTDCGGGEYYPGNPKGASCGSGEDFDCDLGTCTQDTNCGCGMCDF